MEVKGSRCLRREQSHGDDRKLMSQRNAKDECSENRRCIGIESFNDKFGSTFFSPCLDSIYRPTIWDKKGGAFKKAEGYGKCTAHG